jgi:integrase/recombinase XerD
MLAELFPRAHVRFASQPLLGPHLDGFVEWLYARGYPGLPIRRRIRKTPYVDAALHRRGVGDLGAISRAELLELAPSDSQDDIDLAATVRSLVDYLDERGLLARSEATPHERLVAAYRDHLDLVRGLADSTVTHHGATASELLGFLDFDRDCTVLRRLGPRQVEAFLRVVGTRVSRETMQHTVAHLRSFLRFLASRGEVSRGLDTSIDTPRVYRGERLPRALAWETVLAFLAGIDRASPMGQRDYAMFMLIATYGLRTSEVAALRLDDIEWRAGRLRVPRPKTRNEGAARRPSASEPKGVPWVWTDPRASLLRRFSRSFRRRRRAITLLPLFGCPRAWVPDFSSIAQADSWQRSVPG